MAILKIARMGHPVLMGQAGEVDDPGAPEVRRLIADLHETLEDAGGIGLAAPQVHVPLRMVLFEIPAGRLEAEGDSETEQPVAPTILINPVIEPASDEMTVGWEGCLSLPGLRGAVPRHVHIRYRGLGPDGTPIEREAADFHARVVQHECDHLDGILFPMRMTDLSTLHFVSEIRYNPGLRAPLDEDQAAAEEEAEDEDAA